MKNVTKHSLWTSGLSLLLCMALLLGTTFAWFTDSVTNTGNKIEAGTLSVDFNKLNKTTDAYEAVAENTPIFSYAFWEPGYTAMEAFQVHNGGSLALKYDLALEPDGALTKLAEVIDVYYKVTDTPVQKTDLPGSMADLAGFTKAGTLQSNALALSGKVAPGADQYLVVVLNMRTEADNTYQGLPLVEGGGAFNVVLKATQDAVEQDGFGNDDYDANANADAVFGGDILTALNDPTVPVVVAGSDIDMNDPVFDDHNGNDTFVIPDGKTLDLGGNSFIRPASGSGSGLVVKSGSTVTLKNGTMVNEGDMTLMDVEYGSTLTVENVDFTGFGDEAIRVRANGDDEKVTVIFRDCTFTNAPVSLKGMNGASEVDVQFYNCTFKGTYKMYNADGTVATDPYGHIHYTSYLISAESNYLCGNMTIQDCTFDLDCSEASYKREIVSLYGCNYGGMMNVSLKNVTMTGQKVTPVDIDSRYEDGLTFTEESCSYTVDGVSVNHDGTAK